MTALLSLALELQTGQLSIMHPLESRSGEYGPHSLRSQPGGPQKGQQLPGTRGIGSPPPPSGAPASTGDIAGTPCPADGDMMEQHLATHQHEGWRRRESQSFGPGVGGGGGGGGL